MLYTHSLCSHWKRLKRLVQGPLRALRSLSGPRCQLRGHTWSRSRPLHIRTYREAAAIQTALLIIDMIVICSSIAPSALFSGDRSLVWPRRGIFRGRIPLRGPMRITPHLYAFINNANPRPVVAPVQHAACVLIPTHCFPTYGAGGDNGL